MHRMPTHDPNGRPTDFNDQLTAIVAEKSRQCRSAGARYRHPETRTKLQFRVLCDPQLALREVPGHLLEPAVV